ncbi:hypothetical protein [Phormidium tenue]|uniref:hypothetical protein n=1 Tax=Phormidium tenue TaxID=126344 RepID=UPI0015C57CE4|nr:hypothetical protein [Phormidium tenue]MBD2232312.1 hypothetical protein [Phormidium tenue FACHB-1052]
MAALTTGDSAAGLLSFLPDSPIVAFTVLLLVTTKPPVPSCCLGSLTPSAQ